MKTANSQFEQALAGIFKNSPEGLKEFVCAPASKRLRPKLIFATLQVLDLPITPGQMKVALAIEILHNATLIHDDIIDESVERRGVVSFYKKYGAKKSVILGDYLLSIAMKLVAQIGNAKVLEIFSDNMLKICEGELATPSPKNYIEKITKKTALLFVCGVSSALELADTDVKTRQNLENFALNYGIAFQIKDDIDDNENIHGSMKKEFTERAKSDIKFLEQGKKRLLTAFLDDLE